MNNKFIAEACLALRPDAGVSVEGIGKINWDENTTDIPTESEIQAEAIRLEKEYSDNEYSRNRALAYDSIGNQLDMIYKDNLNGTTTHKDSVEAVKAKYPKPS